MPSWSLSWSRICLQCGRPGLNLWFGKFPWRRVCKPTLVFLPGESPWTEDPGRLQSTGSQRVGHDRATEHSAFLDWSLVDLQCCISFRCTAKSIRYTCIHIYIYIHIYTYVHTYIHTYTHAHISFSESFSLRVISRYWYSSLCYTVGPCCWVFLMCVSVYMHVYMKKMSKVECLWLVEVALNE